MRHGSLEEKSLLEEMKIPRAVTSYTIYLMNAIILEKYVSYFIPSLGDNAIEEIGAILQVTEPEGGTGI